MRIDKVVSGKPHFNDYNQIIFKGNMVMLPNTSYRIKGEFISDPKWGGQYNLIYSKRETPVEGMNTDEFKQLLVGLSPVHGRDIANTYGDKAKEIFENSNIEALTKINGIGAKTAKELLYKYESQKDLSPAYVAFGKWGFSIKLTQKIVYSKKSVDSAIETLKRNPYEFMDVQGVGFKTIDERAMKFGIKANDPRRVRAFIKCYFDDLEMSGSSWVYAKTLLNYLRKEIFNCDLEGTLEWINSSDLYVVYEIEGVKVIASKDLYDTERRVAIELLRLADGDGDEGEDDKKLEDIDDVIETTVQEQGFDYAPEQLSAIHRILDNKVAILNGGAGVGKTTVLNGVVKVLQHNRQSIATCALSGKAADNMSQITGYRGSTIHKLLGITEGGQVAYNRYNKLPFDIIIVDEISMVDIRLFKKLIEAIPSSSRLIMVGDSAQLDSIGVSAMRGMLQSKVVPKFTLTKIHRQAENSAIITHSRLYRRGRMPVLKEDDSWKMFGTNKDLGYVFENKDSEEENILKDTLKVYRWVMSKYGTSDIQVLSPTTRVCDRINSKIQSLANPALESKREFEVNKGKDYSYVLREGDRVLNTANNYQSISAEDERKIIPIFNGNTGIVKKIDGPDNDPEFVISFDGVGTVKLNSSEIRSVRLGYAMTVHKSQGSTISCVIVALPFQYMLNSRELLYTAITRSKEKCFILTSMRTLKATVKKSSEVVHHSNLAKMIREESEMR